MNTEETQNPTPGPIYIGFSGKKQTGKDTSAAIVTSILSRQGIKVQVTSFASALKQMCIDVLGLPKECVYGSDEEKNRPSHIVWDTLPDEIRLKYATDLRLSLDGHGKPDMRTGPMTNREVLQVVGTDIFREMLLWSVWIDIPFRRQWDADVVLITDVRFLNEKEIIEQHGGAVLRLTRQTGLEGDSHLSETALDDTEFEFNYQNDNTIPELADFLDRFSDKVIDGRDPQWGIPTIRPCQIADRQEN